MSTFFKIFGKSLEICLLLVKFPPTALFPFHTMPPKGPLKRLFFSYICTSSKKIREDFWFSSWTIIAPLPLSPTPLLRPHLTYNLREYWEFFFKKSLNYVFLLQNTLFHIFFTFVLEKCQFCSKVQFLLRKRWYRRLSMKKKIKCPIHIGSNVDDVQNFSQFWGKNALAQNGLSRKYGNFFQLSEIQRILMRIVCVTWSL